MSSADVQGVCRAQSGVDGSAEGIVIFCERALPGEALRAVIMDVKKGVIQPGFREESPPLNP